MDTPLSVDIPAAVMEHCASARLPAHMITTTQRPEAGVWQVNRNSCTTNWGMLCSDTAQGYGEGFCSGVINTTHALHLK